MRPSALLDVLGIDARVECNGGGKGEPVARLIAEYGATVAVFVSAPHQYVQPRAGDQELTWTPLQQVIGATYVWYTVLLFVLLWFAWRSRPAKDPATLAP